MTAAGVEQWRLSDRTVMVALRRSLKPGGAYAPVGIDVPAEDTTHYAGVVVYAGQEIATDIILGQRLLTAIRAAGVEV